MNYRERLYGLVVRCTFRDECSDCPFKELRNLNSYKKQIEFIDNMTDDEIKKLMNFHDNRRIERENNIEI
jgi:hypothetical protein